MHNALSFGLLWHRRQREIAEELFSLKRGRGDDRGGVVRSGRMTKVGCRFLLRVTG